MNEPLLMSPTFPTPVGISGGAAVLGRRLLMRKTVDYHASTLHYLEVSIRLDDLIYNMLLYYRIGYGKEINEIFHLFNQTPPTIMKLRHLMA